MKEAVLRRGLSRRQLQVALLLPKGLTDREIGERLGISESTVNKHLILVFRKLGVRNRTQAAMEISKH